MVKIMNIMNIKSINLKSVRSKIGDNKFLSLLIALLCLPVLFYGCGGGSGASIATQEPGDVYLPGVQTPAYEKYVAAQESFEIGAGVV